MGNVVESEALRVWSSPVGLLELRSTAAGVRKIHFLGEEPLPLQEEPAAPGAEALLDRLIHQLEEYFLGLRRTFDLPLALEGPPFQLRVWEALREIPYGATASYEDIARRVERPKAFRAVGGANHANPVAIVVPCHRVVGKDGTLTGFGGGLDKKAWLLEHEGRHNRP